MTGTSRAAALQFARPRVEEPVMVPPEPAVTARPAGVGRPGARDDREAVLRCAQHGQAWAVRALYDELAPRVAGYLRAHGAGDVDDLTSEVFLAVLPRLATVTGGTAGLRSLVFSVAHARLVDSLRAQARRPEAVTYDPAADPRHVRSAEDEAMARLGSEQAIAALAQLPGSQREVISLRVLADLSVEQVATVLGTSQGAVKQLQRRGLLRLRALLAEGSVTR